MQNLTNSTTVDIPEAAIIAAVPDQRLPDEPPANKEIPNITAQQWFAQGSRVPYDRRANKILAMDEETNSPDVVQVFRQITNPEPVNENAAWTSYLPGWPDGSFGWAKVDQHLTGKDIGPRLYVEYVGHGDSDKPDDHPYGTFERADLVEAFWAVEGIKSTFIVGFDYSSIVALELLSRQQDRRDKGINTGTRIEGVLLINGGLFVDAHTHPWFTTPVLKSPIGGLVTSLAQRSKFVFGELMKPLWSKDYVVTREEIDELYNAIARRNGVVSMSKSAGFVDQHKQNAERWDFSRIFHASRGAVSFHIVGSKQDPFEGRQAVAARERLSDYGLDVRILPGGHLTTSEHPELLAQIILEVIPDSEPLL